VGGAPLLHLYSRHTAKHLVNTDQTTSPGQPGPVAVAAFSQEEAWSQPSQESQARKTIDMIEL
jgi:hypothetical protein